MNILYINLDKREDRLAHVQKELDKLGWLHNAQRFPAVAMKNGAIGCTISHIKCIEIAREKRWPHVIILEDDIEFTNPELFLKQFNLFIQRHSSMWDVVLLAGNNMIPYSANDQVSVQIYNCQTTTGYMVQSHYYDTMIKNMREGLGKLLKEPAKKSEYAIDRYWLQLQKRDSWFLIVPLTVVQREDYSDIEGKQTDFRNYMLNLNKAYRT